MICENTLWAGAHLMRHEDSVSQFTKEESDMSAKFRWMIVLSLTILLAIAGAVPAAAHPGLPPATGHGVQSSPAAVSGAWNTAAPAPTAGWLIGGASVDGCTLYAFGGNLPGGGAAPDVDHYNPVTNLWTARAPMPEGLYGIQPTPYDTNVYIVGGYLDLATGLYAASSTLIYDSLADTWTSGAPIPVGDNGIATGAQAAYDGKIYYFGGDDGDFVSNDTTWEYTIISDTWTLRASMPTKRENTVAVTLNGKIYVAGGADGADPAFPGLSTFEVYDPATDTWATLAPMQVARVSPGIATDGATIYVYGGMTDLGDAFSSLDSVERYDPATNTWTYLDSMAQSSAGMVAAYAAGRLYASAGLTAVGGDYTRIDTNQYLPIAASDCLPAIARSRRFAVTTDSFLNGTQPGANFGSASTMWVGFQNQMRPVVWADIPVCDDSAGCIPAGSAVDVAYLYLYVTEGRGFTTWDQSLIDSVTAHALLSPWTQEGATWVAPWQTAGGDLGPALDSTHLGSGRVGAWLRFDVTAHVQQVVAGVSPNYGFALTSADDTWDPTEAINGVRYGLASSEHWDASKAGYLRVMFRTFTE